MRLLIHICCANCAIYPINNFKQRDIEVSGLWFNPNIHPVTEYNERLKSVKTLQNKMSIDVIFLDEYGLVDFVRHNVFNEQKRCQYCYTTRLEKTAKTAKDLSMDAFTTSLFISPYQDFNLINSIGKYMASKYDLDFYVDDFRPYFYESRRLGREMGF
ncbi:MAG: epoxyqueuosine reductase QueH, partial [Thermodesulfovibrionales bacterium]|nr:epoxyqueuosine reductase QueH [Thermodesulfovibrionales bacterium]